MTYKNILPKEMNTRNWEEVAERLEKTVLGIKPSSVGPQAKDNPVVETVNGHFYEGAMADLRLLIEKAIRAVKIIELTSATIPLLSDEEAGKIMKKVFHDSSDLRALSRYILWNYQKKWAILALDADPQSFKD
jgi:hypothetical protein